MPQFDDALSLSHNLSLLMFWRGRGVGRGTDAVDHTWHSCMRCMPAGVALACSNFQPSNKSALLPPRLQRGFPTRRAKWLYRVVAFACV